MENRWRTHRHARTLSALLRHPGPLSPRHPGLGPGPRGGACVAEAALEHSGGMCGCRRPSAPRGTWVPAFAGMTKMEPQRPCVHSPGAGRHVWTAPGMQGVSGGWSRCSGASHVSGLFRSVFWLLALMVSADRSQSPERGVVPPAHSRVFLSGARALRITSVITLATRLPAASASAVPQTPIAEPVSGLAASAGAR